MAENFTDDFSSGNYDLSVNNKTKEQSNPFSFSNFVVGSSTSDGDVVSRSTKEELNRLIGDDDDDDDDDNGEENPFSFENFTSSIASKNTGRKLQIIDDDDEESFSLSSNGVQSTIRGNKLGECGLSGWDNKSESLNESYDTDSEESEHLVKIENLCKENKSLRNELAKVKDEFLEYRRTANKRVTSLQKELEKLRKKEAEETQDLDNVVRMVEENLRKTTARAVNAESVVSKLKEELKLARQESVTREAYDTLVLENMQLVNTIQEKSRGVAQLMRTAAEKTEPHVKQLLSGVASLHFFAEQLDNISKVAEVPIVNNSKDNLT